MITMPKKLKDGLFIAISVLLLATVAAYANTISLDWDVYMFVDSTNLDNWHDEATDRLQDDDDGGGSADVDCCVTVEKNSEFPLFVYAFGDDEIDDNSELTTCFAAFSSECALLSNAWNGYGGVTEETVGPPNTYKIIIFVDDATTPSLAHELHHWADFDAAHSTVYKRITMVASVANNPGNGGAENRCRVIQSEADSFEDLDIP